MKTVLFSILIFLSFSMAHPFYLSVCDLKYNSSSKKLEGTVKLFTNDLEDALRRLENRPVDLINSKNKVEALALLSKYLKNRLKLKEKDKSIPYTLLGYEIEEESIWVYIETSDCSSPKSIQIENSILYDFLKEQMNIMNLEIAGVKKSWKLNNPEKTVLFEF
jgi:hypothetical protein